MWFWISCSYLCVYLVTIDFPAISLRFINKSELGGVFTCSVSHDDIFVLRC